MTAPLPAARRSPWIPLLLVAAFLLTGQLIFFLGPLAALLLFSRPTTGREWVWIAITGAAFAFTLAGKPSLAQQTIRAGVATFTGALVVATLAGMRSLFNRAACAAAIATAATAAWFATFRLTFAGLQANLRGDLWQQYRSVLPALPSVPPAVGPDLTAAASGDTAMQLAEAVHILARYFPALLFLSAMVGAWLAWIWYYRIAHAPAGLPPRPFRDFTFNDHYIWAVVVAAAIALLAHAPLVQLAAYNALAVLFVWYLARGFAIVVTMLHSAPLLLKVILFVIGIVVLPFGCVALGLADTWLDIRRRLTPHPGVPK